MKWFLILVAGLLWPSAAHAQDAREAEMFGTTAETASISTSKYKLSDFASETPAELSAEHRVEAILSRTDDVLTVGGRTFVAVNYNLQRDLPASDYAFSSPNLADLYLDARPNEQLRTYLRGRVYFDPTKKDGQKDFLGRETNSTSVMLEQMWLKFDIDRQLFVTVGRQPIKWGSSRFWNPSDFVNQDARDPLAIFDQRIGPTLVKLHYPLEALGWNFYALATLDHARTGEEIGGALRAEILVDKTEISLSTLVAKGEATRFALDVSTAIWRFDLRLESSFQKGVKTLFWRRVGSDDPFMSIESFDRKEDWLYQIVVGADASIQYSDEDSVLIGVEYFYNEVGYTDASLYAWLAYQGQFQPFYVGKEYAAAYVLLSSPGTWNDSQFVLSAIGNLSDRSSLARLDYRVTLLTYLHLNLFATYHFGQRGEFKYGLSIPPLALVEGLKDGLEISPPTLDLGLRLTVNW